MSTTNVSRTHRIVRQGVNERVATHYIMDADFSALEKKVLTRLVNKPQELQLMIDSLSATQARLNGERP